MHGYLYFTNYLCVTGKDDLDKHVKGLGRLLCETSHANRGYAQVPGYQIVLERL